jgi:hypothetical protein
VSRARRLRNDGKRVIIARRYSSGAQLLISADEMRDHQVQAPLDISALDKLVFTIDVVKCKWVYKKKINEDGELERFKARLVAKGYSQHHDGIDYNEVFAPTSKSTTLRALLAKAAKEDMVVHQMDVMTAFLNGQLEETVYMEQPEDYVQGGRTTVCRLLKSLYGLKQAPRMWHLELKKEANKIGLQASDADPALFQMDVKGKIALLLVYVDDFLSQRTRRQLWSG